MQRFRLDQYPIALSLFAACIALGLLAGLLRPQTAQNREATQFMSRQLQAEREFKEPVFFPQNATPRWPLTAETMAYKSIDGDHMIGYVKELAEIAHHSRDRGVQLWGRITGSPEDEETAQWFMQKLRQMGITEVHQERLDLPPQQVPKSWEAVLSGNGKTLKLESAVAGRGAPGTPNGSTMDLEAFT